MEEIKEKNPQIIFSWKAPLRPYRKRSKKVLRFYLALTFLISLIVFFFGDKILIIPIIAVFFAFYVLTVYPPPEVENKITRFGIESAGITIRWEVLSHFYFKKKFNFYVLTLISHPPFFYHIFLVVPNKEIKNRLINLLTPHLIYQENLKKSLTEKAVDFFVDLMPEDEEDSTTNTNLKADSTFPQKEKLVSL